MSCLRKTVASNLLDSIFDLPLTLRNTKVEVIILPVEPAYRIFIGHAYILVGCLGKLPEYENVAKNYLDILHSFGTE